MLLQELTQAFAANMKAINDLSGKPDRSADDTRALDEAINRGKSLKADIDRAQETLKLAEWGEKSAGMLPLAGAGKTAGKTTLEGWLPAGFSDDDEGEGLVTPQQFKAISTKSYSRAFRTYLRGGGTRGMDQDAIKTLQEGADQSGGFLVPADILARIVAKEPTPAMVASRVTQLPTGRDALVMPKVNYSTDDIYTTGIRATWTGEIPASATTARVTDPVFGQLRIPVHTAMLSMPLTNDLVEDAMFPIVSWASGKFSETIDLLRDNMILNGTGIGQPMGILANPGGTGQPAVIVSGSASAYTADGLVNLTMSLPPQYDANGVAVFSKTSSAKAIAQLKDSNNRYLWGAGLQDSGLAPGWKDRKLLGYDTLLSEFMPAVGASAYPMIFGDLSGYYWVNRVGFSIQVLRELYAETNQILLLGRYRVGGQVAEDWKLKIHQLHT